MEHESHLEFSEEKAHEICDEMTQLYETIYWSVSSTYFIIFFEVNLQLIQPKIQGIM